MKLIKQLETQTEHDKQVQIVLDAMENGYFSKQLAAKRAIATPESEAIAAQSEETAILLEVIDECTFIAK